MTLSLEFEDKYRLWATLVKGAADRCFIATSDMPIPGRQVPVRLAVPSQHMEMQLKALVVGRRRGSDRFPDGVYVRFSSEDLGPCRRHFKLAPNPERYKRGRRAPRVHQSLPVRLKVPGVSTVLQARNVSQTGLQLGGVAGLRDGQRVELELTLDDGARIELSAEVVWVNPAEVMVGLRFVEVGAAASEALTVAVQRMVRLNQYVPASGKRGVVVAEGDEPSLALLHEVLELHQVDIFCAQTGEDVISFTHWFRPAVVFLDILMPGVDALDVCRLMRAEPDLLDTPIIFFSQLEAGRLREVADEAGATDYLTKPAIIGELYRLVARYLRPAKETGRP